MPPSERPRSAPDRALPTGRYGHRPLRPHELVERAPRLAWQPAPGPTPTTTRSGAAWRASMDGPPRRRAEWPATRPASSGRPDRCAGQFPISLTFIKGSRPFCVSHGYHRRTIITGTAASVTSIVISITATTPSRACLQRPDRPGDRQHSQQIDHGRYPVRRSGESNLAAVHDYPNTRNRRPARVFGGRSHDN